MAGFEVIVRPVVFPDIRPSPPRTLSPENDPGQGVAVLGGAGMESIQQSYNMQTGWTRSKPGEKERTVTTQRIYQKETDGTINRDNYIDVDVATQFKMLEGDGTEKKYFYSAPIETDNIETLEEDKVIKNPAWSEGSGAAAP